MSKYSRSDFGVFNESEYLKLAEDLKLLDPLNLGYLLHMRLQLLDKVTDRDYTLRPAYHLIQQAIFMVRSCIAQHTPIDRKVLESYIQESLQYTDIDLPSTYRGRAFDELVALFEDNLSSNTITILRHPDTLDSIHNLLNIIDPGDWEDPEVLYEGRIVRSFVAQVLDGLDSPYPISEELIARYKQDLQAVKYQIYHKSDIHGRDNFKFAVKLMRHISELLEQAVNWQDYRLITK